MRKRCLATCAMMVALAVATSLVAGIARAAEGTVIDDFSTLSGWTATASPGATVDLGRSNGGTEHALRADFDLGSGGFIILRKAVSMPLPPNYVFTFELRGEGQPNSLEFKLIDPTNENVWWQLLRGFELPHDTQRITIRRSGMHFAWGPSAGKPLEAIAAIEIAFGNGTGGKGSLSIANLRFEPRPEQQAVLPKPHAEASTQSDDQTSEKALDGDPDTEWRSGSVADEQWLKLDFGALQEFGGLVLDWDPQDYATAYRLDLSDDGNTWTTAHTAQASTGGRDYVYLHDAEARYLRLVLQHSQRGQGYGIREITVKPLSFSATPNDFFANIAAESPLGSFPKYFTGAQTYWTVLGAPGDSKDALFNEEGMLEVERGSFSLEPFIYVDGRLFTWSTPTKTRALERGALPIPSVTWHEDGIALTITALAAGPTGSSVLYARYRLENELDARRDVLLFVAVRPFQVLPPWQSLNLVGGVTHVRTLSADERTLWVNGDRAVLSLTPPERFGAATFDEDLLPTYLRHGRVPPRASAADGFGYAAGAFEYRVGLEPHAHADVVLAVPWHGGEEDRARLLAADPPEAQFERELTATAERWDRDTRRVEFEMPTPTGDEIARTIRSTIAYIEVNRDGPAFQPGPRTYARSWIRDGAFTSSAMLEFGHTEPVRAFLQWFAGYQLPDGRIPCCIDSRGADRVAENDSNGEFLYALASYYRYTRDVGFVYELWPAVTRAVDWIAGARAQRLTTAYARPDKIQFYGLLPESISHEGYSARPVHSYWDDFFALRGLKDATALARAIGDDQRAATTAALRDALGGSLYASIARTMEKNRIDFIPGSAELGDFDATSTAIAVSPGGELPNLPQPALNNTFKRYLTHIEERNARQGTDEAYTPYELRNVDALIQMGQRETAFTLLRSMLADRRPAEWNEWAEVVWRRPSLPRFIGDMPHTWVGSSFLRSVRSMFVYERESDQSLVLGAGVPAEWMEDTGVAVKRMPTPHGVLHYTLRPEGDQSLRWHISGDLVVPPGGLVLRPPLPAPLIAAQVNGVERKDFGADQIVVRELPADVVLEWGAAVGG